MESHLRVHTTRRCWPPLASVAFRAISSGSGSSGVCGFVRPSRGLAFDRARKGDIELVPLNDGICKMSQEFYVGLDFANHTELLADDGLVHIPVGCFLLRTGGTTVLIDAGLGDVDVGWGRGGELPAAFGAAGASPEDIDAVVCSHLHIDHIGWLVVDGAPYFPECRRRAMACRRLAGAS